MQPSWEVAESEVARQFSHGRFKGCCDIDKPVNGDGRFPSFHFTKILRVQHGGFGRFFLCHFSSVPVPADSLSEKSPVKWLLIGLQAHCTANKNGKSPNRTPFINGIFLLCSRDRCCKKGSQMRIPAFFIAPSIRIGHGPIQA